MAPLRWQSPWDPFFEFQREVNRLFDQNRSRRGPGTFSALNMHECPDRYEITAELPGMKHDQIELSISGDQLSLRLERRRPQGTAENRFRRQERVFGSWHRSIALPGQVDRSRVEAHFRHGVLTIAVPKAKETQPRQIPVTS